MKNKVLIAGTVAYDSLKTPFGEREKIVGGSGFHAAISASSLVPVNLVGVVGGDYEKENIELLNSRGIDTQGIEIIKEGKTFFWKGYYENDMNQAHTKQTDLNVLTQFDPKLPDDYKESEYVFLANIDPDIQLKIIEQLSKPKVIALDTMNFWIDTKKEQLMKVIKKIDILLINDAEIRQLMGLPNIIKAARELIGSGHCKTIVIKKGEHGAVLVTEKEIFAVPSYPLEVVIDPTGAGDTFAGGFISYLAHRDNISEKVMRKAIVYGSTMASFNVEAFSCERTLEVTKEEIIERSQAFKELSAFEKLVL